MSGSNSSFSSRKPRAPARNGRQVVAEIGPFSCTQPLQRATWLSERARLAQELHDGALQSLAAAALQVEAVSHVIEADPDKASDRLRGVAKIIEQGQCELRALAERLGSAAPAMTAPSVDLAAALAAVREALERKYGVRVELSMSIRSTVSRLLGREIPAIVYEALTNVGRHARASVAYVSIELGRDTPVRIAVADDGCGFPFRGRYDLRQLTARRVGPKSLRERVAALGGQLILTSELSGSRLEISLPREEHARQSSVLNSATM